VGLFSVAAENRPFFIGLISFLEGVFCGWKKTGPYIIASYGQQIHGLLFALSSAVWDAAGLRLGRGKPMNKCLERGI
jgi:hypothetical protein